jgi:uracil phosphoribosyltransferase
MNINVTTHPLIEDKIARLRNIKTNTMLFRDLVNELSILIAYESTQDLKLIPKKTTTPVAPAAVKMLADKQIALIPVLRAGLGMVNGFLALLPQAHVWHLGMRRDERTLIPEIYYNNLKQDAQADIAFLLDPMLATGGTTLAALKLLKEKKITNVKVICLIAAPEGIHAVNQAFPSVKIYTAMIDQKLNEVGYIVPGLGDAGDRLFGT